MYYNPLKKKKIDVVVSRASSYSLLASLLLSLNKKIKIMTYKVNPAKRNVMVVKNEMRLLKQKRNVLQI